MNFPPKVENSLVQKSSLGSRLGHFDPCVMWGAGSPFPRSANFDRRKQVALRRSSRGIFLAPSAANDQCRWTISITFRR
jgi:hypothetical protein